MLRRELVSRPGRDRRRDRGIYETVLYNARIGLFVILGVVMFLTRRINWYNPGGDNEAASGG